jgi:AcrR family transcriptional regulator
VLTTKPLTKRQQQGEQSRSEILDAAGRLMSRHGFDGASMAALQKESGLPASSIYHHFSSKEGVLLAVMERGAQRFFGVVDEVVPAGGSPLDIVRAELRTAARAVDEDPDFLRLFIMLRLSRGDDATVARVRAAGLERIHALLLAAYSGRGRARARRVADRFAIAGLAMFDGAFLAIQNDPTLSMENLLMDMADALTHLCDSYIARLDARKSATRRM